MTICSILSALLGALLKMCKLNFSQSWTVQALSLMTQWSQGRLVYVIDYVDPHLLHYVDLERSKLTHHSTVEGCSLSLNTEKGEQSDCFWCFVHPMGVMGSSTPPPQPSPEVVLDFFIVILTDGVTKNPSPSIFTSHFYIFFEKIWFNNMSLKFAEQKIKTVSSR